LLKKDRVLPVSVVANATEQDIYLTISSSEIGDFPEYREVTIKEPAPEAGNYRSMANAGMSFGGGYVEPHIPMVRRRLHEGITAGKAVIGRKTGVETLNKAIGHVDHVIADQETNEITHVVMRRGLFPEYLVIPAEKVEDVGEAIFVPLSPNELEALPRYQADGEVEELSPVVTTSAAGGPDLAPQLGAADVAGQVHMALATDPRTKDAVIDVICDRGVIKLLGEVNDGTTRRAAEAIATAQPGIVSVHNELVIVR
jgi:hypothetical protein